MEEELKILEKQKEEYLEADMNKEASRIQIKINKLVEKIELQELRNLKNELKSYKLFITNKGMEKEFIDFQNRNLGGNK